MSNVLSLQKMGSGDAEIMSISWSSCNNNSCNKEVKETN